MTVYQDVKCLIVNYSKTKRISAKGPNQGFRRNGHREDVNNKGNMDMTRTRTRVKADGKSSVANVEAKDTWHHNVLQQDTMRKGRGK